MKLLGSVTPTVSFAKGITVFDNHFTASTDTWQSCPNSSISNVNDQLQINTTTTSVQCGFRQASFTDNTNYELTFDVDLGTTPGLTVEIFPYGVFSVVQGANTITFNSNQTVNGSISFVPTDLLANYQFTIDNVILDELNTTVANNVNTVIDYFPYGRVLREFQDGEAERYMTTQHERDEETGLDYRGARYYDSDIGRFLSLDPMSEDYPSLSDYNYVAANPIVLIDPDGKEVVFAKGTNKEERKEMRQIKRNIRRLNRKSETFNSIYNDLDNSSEVYTVGTTGMFGGDSFQSTTHKLLFNVSGGSSGHPLIATIAHEFGHAWRHAQSLEVSDLKSPFSEGSPEHFAFSMKAKMHEEFEGMHIENVVRSEIGMDLREEYGEMSDYNALNVKTLGFSGIKSADYDKMTSVKIKKNSSYNYSSSGTKSHYSKLKERQLNSNDINVYTNEDPSKYK